MHCRFGIKIAKLNETMIKVRRLRFYIEFSQFDAKRFNRGIKCSRNQVIAESSVRAKKERMLATRIELVRCWSCKYFKRTPPTSDMNFKIDMNISID